MTWEEFKQVIDEQIKEQKISSSIPLYRISFQDRMDPSSEIKPEIFQHFWGVGISPFLVIDSSICKGNNGTL